ncbi:MAG TPA: galactokinase [Clostridiales bacterium]|nr:galactokinase [Clostridiales bacterium]
MELTSLGKKLVEIFGGTEDGIRYFRSPGRVNLIGEHTDYNGGYVFPAALDMYTTVAARPRGDRMLGLAATDLPDRVLISLDSLETGKNLPWGNYQLGVADELAKAGYPLTGCDMLFHDTVPHGAGLSSSAAIEVATAVALATLGRKAADTGPAPLDMPGIARICQLAENRFVGVNCGIMDQFASAMGRIDHAILLDCRDLSYTLVPLRLADCRIIISNTMKKRSLATSKYNERRSECEQGLAALKKAIPNAACLGDICMEEFTTHQNLIENDIVRKRCEHVISEDERVLKSVEALKNNDIAAFGRLMSASHDSLRDLYEVTGFELDTLVEEALKIKGVLGSRMTGAGFGGCTVSIVKASDVPMFIQKVGEAYQKKTGTKPEFHTAGTGDGGREL